MRIYKKNSPEAVSRIVAMALISDAELHDRELEALDETGFFEKIGISKPGFADVFADYCRDLTIVSDSRGRVRMLDVSLVDRVLEDVDDPALQSTALMLISKLLKADGKTSAEEAALFHHILRRWDEARHASP